MQLGAKGSGVHGHLSLQFHAPSHLPAHKKGGKQVKTQKFVPNKKGCRSGVIG